mmetsp:Transcript_39306/g.91742  ORF Transcript_39306/g.91742 Transcript_39306/m.91742 type:complete len:277 (+) Transcript_39306:1249-2079(+)
MGTMLRSAPTRTVHRRVGTAELSGGAPPRPSASTSVRPKESEQSTSSSREESGWRWRVDSKLALERLSSVSSLLSSLGKMAQQVLTNELTPSLTFKSSEPRVPPLSRPTGALHTRMGPCPDPPLCDCAAAEVFPPNSARAAATCPSVAHSGTCEIRRTFPPCPLNRCVRGTAPPVLRRPPCPPLSLCPSSPSSPAAPLLPFFEPKGRPIPSRHSARKPSESRCSSARNTAPSPLFRSRFCSTDARRYAGLYNSRNHSSSRCALKNPWDNSVQYDLT